MLEQYYRVRAEIDLDQIRKNITGLKARLLPGTQACAVIKADGYGHGAVPIAKACGDLIDYFAVATIDEALNLRAHEIFHPILVIGFVHPSKFKAAIENDIRLTLYSMEQAETLSEAAKAKGKDALVHIKLETGMNRLGIPAQEKGISIVKEIAALSGIEIEGIFTHLFLSDTTDKTEAKKQISLFSDFIHQLETEGIRIPIRHCANSAAIIDMPEASFDMVRMGIALYGLYPSEEVTAMKLAPALSLKSHIVMVKEIEAGQTVSYGGTFRAERKTKIATIPIGYADGYQRNLSNKGFVLIRGQKAPVAGRVCMDYIMADVTDLPDVQEGDEVVLIGIQENEVIAMEDLSDLCGIFNYEFACDIGKRVPRLYYREGKLVSCKDYFFDRY